MENIVQNNNNNTQWLCRNALQVKSSTCVCVLRVVDEWERKDETQNNEKKETHLMCNEVMLKLRLE